jgi:hypothetical protein
MKSLCITLLILAAGFLAYDYFGAAPQERLFFARPAANPAPVAAPQTEPAKFIAAAPSVAPPPKTPERVVPPPVTESPPPAPTPAKAITEEEPSFHEPKFDAIEVVTGDWKKIPPSAFPRSVKLLRETAFTYPFGISKVRSGTQVYAQGMDHELVVIAPAQGATVRKSVRIDDTDLKVQLTSSYEQWKVTRVAALRHQFENKNQSPPASADTSKETPAADAAGKPVARPDGAYPLLLAKLQKGDVTDITPQNIIRWGQPMLETIKGLPTWTIEVSYRTKTMFGPMDVVSLAHVREGRVIDWIYKGSGEPIP